MKKLDLKKQFKHLYSAPKRTPVVVEAPSLRFLMIDGVGDPNVAPEFQEAVEALYSMAYTLKFTMKTGAAQVDYPVMALEGLWWTDEGSGFAVEDKSKYHWTLMIMQPDIITPELVEQATQQVRERKDPVALPKVRFESFTEGPCAQIMHIGPYREEGPTIRKLHDFIRANGYELRGKHHEIYLSDPRRSKPENLKTILRQPVQRQRAIRTGAG